MSQIPRPRWQEFESYVAELLDLDATLSSGSKWFDKGDAVSRGRGSFPLYAECKFTTKASKSLALRDLRAARELAGIIGKRFILPLRFWPENTPRPDDFVLLSLSDFCELLQAAKDRES